MSERIKVCKRLRKEVWEHRNGKKYSAKCSITWCDNEIEALGSWHVGHNIAVAKGGTNDIENLYPLCDQCNLSMSTKTIDEFNNLVVIKKKHLCFKVCFCFK
tara:strand:+ start:361 stop:666 length:306 start_codon:yes stop_codon:yes gene_type:complete